MNILQQEDMVKGLPDDRLMQEAKSPTGGMPQFLLVSEIQRRTDMRKRYAAQQEQPEGTVADQIMSGGLGSLQAPTGQGSPQPNQAPPPQPPNAQGMPPQGGQGMAAGGIVRLSGGGGPLSVSMGGSNYSFNRGDYPTDRDAWEAVMQGNNPADVSEGNWDQIWNNDITFNPDGSLRSGRVPDQAVVAADAPDVSGIAAVGVQGHPMPQATGIMDKIGNFFNEGISIPSFPEWKAEKPKQVEEIPSELRESLRSAIDNGLPLRTVVDMADGHPVLQNRIRKMYGSKLMSGMSGAGQTGRILGETEQPAEGFSRWNTAAEAEENIDKIPQIAANIGNATLGAGRQDVGLPPLFGDSYPEDEEDMETQPDPAAETAGIVATVKMGPPAPSGTHPSKTDQLAAASGAVKGGAVKGSALDLLMGQVGKTAGEFPDVSGYAKQQRKDAWSNAIIQIGAGIAGGDLSQGLSKAGDVMAAGNAGAREIEMQGKLAEYQNNQSSIDRDTNVYAKAAQLESLVQADARELLRQHGLDRRAAMTTARMRTDEFFDNDMTVYKTAAEKQAAYDKVFNTYYSQLATQMGIDVVDTDTATGTQHPLTREERLAKYLSPTG